MNLKELFERIFASLSAMDAKKRIMLSGAFVVTLAAVIFISFQASKPTTIPLYSNLSREDLNNMSRILSENGITFIVSTDQNAIEVVPSYSRQARMLLAESGLPSAESTGYQLFDRVNTLGLTSFMQNVTNKRAIEGELVRTIQMINRVSSARVHLVIEERNVFRQNNGANSSASVVLKTTGKLASRSINAIRHMVAAAVPGLASDNVTIVGADGTLLTSKDDAIGGSTKLVEMERDYARSIEEKIQLALGAHLGTENLRVSASVKLNSDKRRIEETIFDPESRIERSVQIIREAGTTENKETASPVTVEQNLPEEEVGGGNGQSSSENSERREELTNYEINQKKISLVSDGYQIEKQSVAVIVNRARVVEILGGTADQTQLEAKTEELRQIVSSALSLVDDRGDEATVTIVDFMPISEDEDSSGSGFADFLSLHFGSIINTLGMIIAAIAFAMLGIRPLLAFLNREPETQPNTESLSAPDTVPALSASTVNDGLLENPLDPEVPAAVAETDATISAAAANEGQETMQAMAKETRLRQQLQQMAEQSEERTVVAIRHWLQQDQANPASSG